MQQGTVKFFNEAKGFGFISPADGSKDIFVHSSGLSTRTIRENDKVTFDVQTSEKGLNAINVKLA
ncbi:cold-shock protein [Chryseobacterium gwangjuense]|uniref:cold-shock protein n=1 Tax=Chryseobacterium gwangjuense TaxID=1069980 RepID=UPI001E2DC122|nr:cold shock domain-containing protein [Chryseobacterium gwangjuense]MCE3076188.1 cold shock domain-containing protein [Chryseobacterium gwangjuense]